MIRILPEASHTETGDLLFGGKEAQLKKIILLLDKPCNGFPEGREKQALNDEFQANES